MKASFAFLTPPPRRRRSTFARLAEGFHEERGERAGKWTAPV